MRPLYVIGRAIFGGYFVYNGINHLRNTAAMGQYAGAKGVPAPEQAVRTTGAMLLAGGSSIAAGIRPRQGLATILAFLIPTTLQMHRFWEVEDPHQRMGEQVNFLKNVALAGAALALMGAEQPAPARHHLSRSEDEEMFIRLGGRELTALPA